MCVSLQLPSATSRCLPQISPSLISVSQSLGFSLSASPCLSLSLSLPLWVSLSPFPQLPSATQTLPPNPFPPPTSSLWLPHPQRLPSPLPPPSLSRPPAPHFTQRHENQIVSSPFFFFIPTPTPLGPELRAAPQHPLPPQHPQSPYASSSPPPQPGRTPGSLAAGGGGAVRSGSHKGFSGGVQTGGLIVPSPVHRRVDLSLTEVRQIFLLIGGGRV